MLTKSFLVYLDNLLILSTNIELHYDGICKNLEWFHENKSKAKDSKYKYAVTKVEYFGYIVENGTITMDSEKICAIVDWPVPLLV